MQFMVDDFSRFTWIYFLQHKSEAFSKFLELKQKVEHEFGQNIIGLCTDNGVNTSHKNFSYIVRKKEFEDNWHVQIRLNKMVCLSEN